MWILVVLYAKETRKFDETKSKGLEEKIILRLSKFNTLAFRFCLVIA